MAFFASKKLFRTVLIPLFASTRIHQSRSYSTGPLTTKIFRPALFSSIEFEPHKYLPRHPTTWSSSQQQAVRSSSSTVAMSESSLPDDAMLDQVLQVAIDASKKAGEIIIGNAGGAEVTERKANSRDLLTLIDPLCEKVSGMWRLQFP
jgi:hypothetical protein